jgi:phosphoglycolate phosphatase
LKYIIFDFDGTLADSTDVFIKAWNLFAPKYRYDPIDIKGVIATKHMSLSQRARVYHFPMHKLPIIMPKVYRYFKEHIKEVKLFDGIKDMINALSALSHGGFKIVVLSSNAKENIELLLKQEGVDYHRPHTRDFSRELGRFLFFKNYVQSLDERTFFW